jgi:hypothetical protein
VAFEPVRDEHLPIESETAVDRSPRAAYIAILKRRLP